MFNSLSQFYNSKKWRSFRHFIINERTNKSDGVLYCQHSQKPLINSYDIVLHHITPLTMANVNNLDVSLNPDNILVVSQQAHNEIHARWGYCAERKVYIVVGSPCSGKSTFVNQIKGNSDIVVDIDDIWFMLTGKKYSKPNALKTNVFSVRDCLYDQIRTRAGKWERAYITTSESSTGAIEKLCDRMGAEIITIDTPKEECLKRLHKNPDGRDIKQWEKFIQRYFE